jgi:hypothetical protein
MDWNSILLGEALTRRRILSQSASTAQSIHKHECIGEKKSHGCRSNANARHYTGLITWSPPPPPPAPTVDDIEAIVVVEVGVGLGALLLKAQ